jgi:hypothetical protein
MLAPPLTLDQALARGEILASNTTESTHVIRIGNWVYKFLRLHTDLKQSASRWRRQIELRVCHSYRHAELNPLEFHTTMGLVVSKFVYGRFASTAESEALCRRFLDSRRGYVVDLNPSNVIITADGPVAIDFEIAEHHADWPLAAYSTPFLQEQ